MTTAAPIVPVQFFTKNPLEADAFIMTPIRNIGKMPVFEDEHGEFVLLHIKIWHPKTKVLEEQQFKVDANIEIIRNAYALTLRNSSEISKKTVQTEGTLGFIVYQNLNNKMVAGETSLPRALFGKDYYYARHVRNDDRDIRKSAFKQKEV